MYIHTDVNDTEKRYILREVYSEGSYTLREVCMLGMYMYIQRGVTR